MPRKKRKPTQRDYIYKPENFDENSFPGIIQEYPDYAIWFLSTIYLLGFRQFQDDDWISLHSSILRKVIDKGILTDLRDALVEHNLIEFNNHYVVGEKSMGYRLGPALSGVKFRAYIPENKGALSKIDRFRAALNEDNGEFTPAHQHARAQLEKLIIREDFESDILRRMKEGEISEVRANHLINQLNEIQAGNLGSSVCRYGRLHTPLTRLCKEGRDYLSFDGRPLIEVDIRNSQLYFLSLVIAKNLNIYNRNNNRETLDRDTISYDVRSVPPDFIQFVEDCQKGVVYEKILGVVGEGWTRDSLKKQVISNLMAKDKYDGKIKRAMTTLYPTVMREVSRLKQEHGHKYVGQTLQRAESSVIFGKVVERLRLEHPDIPLLTIHDSFIVRTDDLPILNEILNEEFGKLEWSPAFKTKPLEPAHSPATASTGVPA